MSHRRKSFSIIPWKATRSVLGQPDVQSACCNLDYPDRLIVCEIKLEDAEFTEWLNMIIIVYIHLMIKMRQLPIILNQYWFRRWLGAFIKPLSEPMFTKVCASICSQWVKNRCDAKRQFLAVKCTLTANWSHVSHLSEASNYHLAHFVWW